MFSVLALKQELGFNHFPLIALNGFLLACANAISNILNQVYDRDIDAAHPKKKFRPIPSGQVSVDLAMSFVFILTVCVVGTSFVVFGLYYGVLMSLILIFAWLYSSPPARLRSRFLWSNLAIATPRGGLGIMTAYSAFASPFNLEIILPAIAFGIYVFGANTFKDFDDYEADASQGVRSIPIVLGKRKATAFSLPFVFVPYTFAALFPNYFSIHIAMAFPLAFAIALMGIIDPELKGRGEVVWMLFYYHYVALMVLYVVPKVML
ncbi:MAG: UbiA family prenyltransferase [Thaumarchaeota archaeon]|nr:UbiA family prenyltransferase [Candidatus Calditenuaceae archaeon]